MKNTQHGSENIIDIFKSLCFEQSDIYDILETYPNNKDTEVNHNLTSELVKRLINMSYYFNSIASIIYINPDKESELMSFIDEQELYDDLDEFAHVVHDLIYIAITAIKASRLAGLVDDNFNEDEFTDGGL
jgi:hypothetical protein